MKKFIFPLSSLLLTLPAAGLFGTTYTNSDVTATTLNTAGTSSDHTQNILDGSLSGTFAYGSSSPDVYVGNANSYIELSILNGGSVTSSYGRIGYGASSDSSLGCNNSVTITGTGSGDTTTKWTSSNELDIGYFGSSNTLSISAGADVTDTYGVIGFQASGTNNRVTITGTGEDDTSTKWKNSVALYVGYGGSSNTLSISVGADVTNTNGYIGYYLKAKNNSVTVTGAGSTWINSGSLTIGLTTNTGNTLTIDNGALVKVGDASGEVLTINVDSDSLNYVKLGSGYLALYGDVTTTTGNGTITALLSGIEVYNSATNTWSVVTSASQLSITYYTAAEEALAATATGYSGLAGYTVITYLATVPEPATYALFGGIGALALVLISRKRHGKSA